jgi:hypothetical protein
MSQISDNAGTLEVLGKICKRLACTMRGWLVEQASGLQLACMQNCTVVSLAH